MITEFVGTAPGQAADTTALAELLRAVHALPPAGKALDAPEQLQRYRALVPRHSACGVLLRAREATIATACARIRTRSAPDVTCHNDLLPANIRCHQGRLIALDWEYAAPGDAFFDIAVCAAQLGGEDAADTLLTDYLGRAPERGERERLRAQQIVYAAIESCWYAHHHPGSDVAQRSLQRLAATLSAADDGAPRT